MQWTAGYRGVSYDGRRRPPLGRVHPSDDEMRGEWMRPSDASGRGVGHCGRPFLSTRRDGYVRLHLC